MKVLVLNGPNINMLGIREKSIYGEETYNDLMDLINEYCDSHNIEVDIIQSNYEGELVNYIQEAYFNEFDGIVINPAAYTHTSIAILDALKAVNIPFVEVHISNIDEREEFRKISYIAPYAEARIIGKGIEGYILAIQELEKVCK